MKADDFLPTKVVLIQKVDEHVEKPAASRVVVGRVNGEAALEKSWHFP